MCVRPECENVCVTFYCEYQMLTFEGLIATWATTINQVNKESLTDPDKD